METIARRQLAALGLRVVAEALMIVRGIDAINHELGVLAAHLRRIQDNNLYEVWAGEGSSPDVLHQRINRALQMNACARCEGWGFEEDFHGTKAVCGICGGSGDAVPCAVCGRPASEYGEEEARCYRHDPSVLRRVRAKLARARRR